VGKIEKGENKDYEKSKKSTLESRQCGRKESEPKPLSLGTSAFDQERRGSKKKGGDVKGQARRVFEKRT